MPKAAPLTSVEYSFAFFWSVPHSQLRVSNLESLRVVEVELEGADFSRIQGFWHPEATRCIRTLPVRTACR